MADDDVIVIDDSPQRKSISCEKIPELFLDKLTAKRHFSQFGRINRFILRPKRFSCTVEYESQQAAEAALARGSVFRDVRFEIYWTDESPVRGETAAGRDESSIDPEVQRELESMSGGANSLRVKQQQHQQQSAVKQSIESFLKKTERFPAPPIVAPPKPMMRNPAPRMEVPPVASSDSKAGPIRAEFESLARRPAMNAEERYRLLESRDKYLRLTTDRTTDILKATSTQGTCDDMCPEKERYMREFKFLVASYEAGESSQQMNHTKAIKQYSRSSADQESPLPHELRSERGLGLAMSYLLHRIADRCEDEDSNMSDWFHFVWDRTRSIRKDITQQELCSLKAVQLVEQCARFHIHCAARLVAEDPSVFDQKINTENMTKCLQSLKYMYHDLGLKRIRCPNEAEFRAYVVLLNLNDGNFLWEVKQLPADILHSQEIRFAMQVYFALENNNYVKFFRLVRQTTYMNACILLRYFNQIRTRALETMLRAYAHRTTANFSLDHFTELLAFEDSEAAASFLECYGLPVDVHQGAVLMDSKQYERPELPYQLERAYNLVESKRTCTVGEAISGETLDDETLLDTHQLEDSFDESGYLKEEILRDMLNRSKAQLEAVSTAAAASNDDKLFKVPSPTSVSPKPLFPKAAPSANLFQPVRTAFKVETTGPTPPLATSVLSVSTPPPSLSGITPLNPANSQPAPVKPTPTPPTSTAAGQNLFGTVSFTTPKNSASTTSAPLFGNFALKSSSIFASARTQPDLAEQEQIRRQQQEQEELQRRKQQQEEALRRKQKQEEELRRKREIDEERMRQELIARKEAEVRRLKELEVESKRQLEATLNSESEKILANLLEEVVREDVAEIGATCHYQHQLLEVLPKKLLAEIEDDLLVEFVTEAVREEVLVKRCQKNRQLNIMRKYFRLWRRNVLMMVSNRAQIENSPAWLPERTLPEQARELYQQHQAVCLANMKRYVGGKAREIRLPERQEGKVDVFEIARKCLPSGKRSELKGFVKNHVYWKVAISIPFKQEEDAAGFYFYINKWLKNVVKRTAAEDDAKCFFLEAKESTTARERQVICMRLLKGAAVLDELNAKDPSAMDNSDGLVFFVTPHNVMKARERLHNLLRNADSWGPIPITIITYNYNHADPVEESLDLEQLLEESKISDFEVLHHRETLKVPLREALAKSLSHLASCYSSESPLVMESQTAFIGTCLGEEFWHRIRVSSDQNVKLAEASQDANFVVQLFNQAVDRVINLVQHDLSVYADFPVEFKPFVSKPRFDIPLDIEHFPKDWRNPDRQQKLVQFFAQLKLKPIAFKCATLADLQQHLAHYIRSLAPPKCSDKTVNRLLSLVTQSILRSLPVGVPPAEALGTLSWLPPLTVLANELLRLRWSAAFVHLPCEVIYHRHEYASYTRTLWWLPQLKNLKRPSLSNGNDEEQPVDLLDGPADQQALAATPAAKKMKLNLSLAKDDLDEILAQGRRCLALADQKLAQCREFTAQSKGLTRTLDGELYQQERETRANRWTWETNFR